MNATFFFQITQRLKWTCFRETWLFEMFIEKTFARWYIDSNKNTVQVQTPYGKTCTLVTKSFMKACISPVLLPFTLQIARDSLVLLISSKAMLMKRLISYLNLSKALLDYLYLSSLPIPFLLSQPSPLSLHESSIQSTRHYAYIYKIRGLVLHYFAQVLNTLKIGIFDLPWKTCAFSLNSNLTNFYHNVFLITQNCGHQSV